MCTFSILKNLAGIFALGGAYALGVYRTVKGKQERRENAPLVVIAPHASFADGVVGITCGLPGVVSAIENVHIPIIGGEATQVVSTTITV